MPSSASLAVSGSNLNVTQGSTLPFASASITSILIEGRYTEMTASLKSPLNDEASSAKGPLPAFGLVGRGYPIKNVSITAEVSGFKLPNIDPDYDELFMTAMATARQRQAIFETEE